MSARPISYALLLRAVNVGGRKLPMADLRALLTELGHTGVQTILASGQAIVISDRKPADIAGELEKRLDSELGLRSEVMIRSGRQLASIVEHNPYPGAGQAGNKYGVVFFQSAVTAAQLEPLTGKDWAPDGFEARDSEIYLSLPNGFGVSKLAMSAGKLKGNAGTTRNWNTVLKLAGLTA